MARLQCVRCLRHGGDVDRVHLFLCETCAENYGRDAFRGYARLYCVSAGKVNVQVPYETGLGPAVVSINNNGEVASFPFTVAVTAPGLYTSAIDSTTGAPVTATPTNGQPNRRSSAESFTVNHEETREIFILSSGPEEQAQTFGFDHGFSVSHAENGSQAFNPVDTVRTVGTTQDVQAGSMFDDLLNDLGSIQFDAATGKTFDSPQSGKPASVRPTPQ